MRSNGRHPVLLSSIVAAALWMAGPAKARQTPAQDESSPAERTGPSSLLERQALIRDRVQQLENRMVKLSRLLSESQPGKAERLRDALEHAGRQRIRARVAELTELLRAQRLSEAEHEQESLLADLDGLLTLLTSSVNEVERRRAQREQLEAFKRSIRTLIDEQMQILYRTRHVAQRFQRSDSPQAPVAGDVGEMLRQLERLQRLAQRAAGDLHREMREPDGQRPPPGTEQIGRAAEQMRQAADRLGEQQPEAARQNQEGVLERLQQALDELDDALRQVRREESEETLAALGIRFRSMLAREREVLEVLIALDSKGVENWTRVDRLQLAESAELHAGVRADCEATLRLLIDEGTTVIVPELVRQMADDMADVSERLERSDTSAAAQGVLDDIIALLEEILGAIERKRAEDAQQVEDGQAPDDDGSRPLLPGSAELKLLRWSQLQLNRRTLESIGAQDRSDGGRAAAMERLSQRQRRLAELARRMNERQ